jgi:pimeloyl-ACP methyl ester carboxylesterase
MLAWNRTEPRAVGGTAAADHDSRDVRMPTTDDNERPEISSRTIEVNGRPMSFHASRGEVPPDRPAVVLVHGFVVASSYMLPTAELLARDFRVLAPDLPGFGGSPGPRRALDVAGLGLALADWMETMRLERAALLANSFGCQVALACALARPERVSHLILQGPTTDPAARTLLGQLRRWIENSRFEPPMSGTMLRDYRRAGLLRAASTARHLLRDAIEEKLPQVRVPALVVRGEHDSLVPQPWAEEVVRLLPEGRLILVPGAAHTVVYFAARECADAVRTFLLSGSGPQAVDGMA